MEVWSNRLREAGFFLPKLKNISSAATAFNSNIDAIVQIKGDAFVKAAKELCFSHKQNNKQRKVENLCDIMGGIFKCFTGGIAEEWSCTKQDLCSEILKIFPVEKMQIGGQGGIMSNLLSICGVQKVINHTNSLPELQAKQFLPNDNLFGFDEKGDLKKITEINRKGEPPLIHIIFEFKKDDKMIFDDKVFTCPKSNRFILSCDELNQRLVIDDNFVAYMDKNPQEYCFLSGFHLLDEKHYLPALEKTKKFLQKWKNGAQKDCVFHLEIASTSDKKVRKQIVDEIGKNVDSLGLNEREAIDLMEVLRPEEVYEPDAKDMFRIIKFLREYTESPRIELHMLGIFMTIQDKNFKISPERTKKGMLLAANVGSSRAALGDLQKYDDLLYSRNFNPSDIGLEAIKTLEQYLSTPSFAETGIAEFADFDLIAIPTPLEAKPKSLVGMGDTISAISLIGA